MSNKTTLNISSNQQVIDHMVKDFKMSVDTLKGKRTVKQIPDPKTLWIASEDAAWKMAAILKVDNGWHVQTGATQNNTSVIIQLFKQENATALKQTVVIYHSLKVRFTNTEAEVVAEIQAAFGLTEDEQ